MSQSTVSGDLYVAGTITGKQNIPSAGAVGNAQMAANANVEATKLIHQWTVSHDQAPGASVVAASKIAHVVKGANTDNTICGLASITAWIDTAPTGDHTISIDVQRSTGGGAWTSVLSAAYVINSASAAKTALAISIAAAALVTGDGLKIVVTVAGSTGAQGQGLLVEAAIREYPQ